MRITSSQISETGLIRGTNQDRTFSDQSGVFAVADGMGGYEGGGYAAEQAISAVRGFTREFKDSLDKDSSHKIIEALRGRLRNLHQSMILDSQTSRTRSGTTLVVCVIVQGTLHCLWVGDSRLYIIQRNKLRLITSDHTVAQEKQDQGRGKDIMPQDHHTLTRSLGIGGTAEPEHVSVNLAETQVEGFILCSDGFSYINDDCFLSAFKANTSPEGWVDGIKNDVIKAGAPDNYACVACCLES